MVKEAVIERAKVAGVKARFKGTIGSMTDQLIGLRERKRLLEAQVDEIQKEFDSVSEALMSKLESEGTDKGTGKTGSVSVSTSVVAQVDDWDAFGKYVIKSNQPHLLQRRVSDAAWRELYEKKGAVPGTSPFSKKRLNLRAA